MLAFDTSGPHVAVALIQGAGTVIAARGAALARGQSEVLLPHCNAVLADAGVAWSDVSSIAVGIGPGNFTGIRIAVAAARGLALGLGVVAVGVSGFEVLVEKSGQQNAPTRALFCIGAPRGQVYVQAFAMGGACSPARLIDPTDDLSGFGEIDYIYGDAALLLGRALRVPGTEFPKVDSDKEIAEIAAQIGTIATRKLQSGVAPDRPAPLYLRPADAAAPSEPPVRVLM